MTDQVAPTKTYRGNCHCGTFIYNITVPEIKGISSCDCSYCSKKGCLWTVVPKPSEQFQIVKGDEENDLTVYQFGTRAFLHKFCKNCGSALFTRWPTGPAEKQMVVNTRCLQDFDTWELPSKTFPGSAVGDPYEAPSFEGPEPSNPDVEDHETYHGSCHCGNIKLAYKTEPLTDKTKVVECNCSICQRNGYIWTYPKREQVVITSTSAPATYSHGLHIFIKTFCSRCGVQIENAARDLTPEELAKCPEGFAPFYESAKLLQPVNLRLLNGFDLNTVKSEKVKGWDLIEPKYVNP